ncbi:MAG: aminotransferase class V-fold PLP-dependent enzyme [Oscillospiraceae bacterium]|nr:aminotransferase class V-fold PLP-dependent enzyme [Oscillospiraceae bacterium]
MMYLDNAATSFLKPNSVRKAVNVAMIQCASPGRGGYLPAMEASRKVLQCRQMAEKLFSCSAEQVVFTSNATHALNVAIRTLVREGDSVVISGFEHNAVLRPLTALHANITVAGRKLFSQEDTLNAFADAITPQIACVICTHVSNVFGYILPVKEIGKLCRERGVPFVVDASQSAGILPVSLEDFSADFIAMPGHKGLYGPQGTGLLLCNRLPNPLLYGGTGSLSANAEMPDFLPDRAEAGTANVPGICGLMKGMEFVSQMGTERIFHHERNLCKKLYKMLCDLGYEQVFFADDSVQTGVLSFVPREDCELCAQRLGERGIAVRAGLHCAPLAHESAGTIETGTVRLSPSVFTTTEQLPLLYRLLHEKNPFELGK